MKIKGLFLGLFFCLFLFGCGDPGGTSDNGSVDVPNEALEILKDLGIDNFILPSGGTYNEYLSFFQHAEEGTVDYVYLIWNNCPKSMFNSYKAAWEQQLGKNLILDLDDDNPYLGYYFPDGITEILYFEKSFLNNDLTINANSIVFVAATKLDIDKERIDVFASWGIDFFSPEPGILISSILDEFDEDGYKDYYYELCWQNCTQEVFNSYIAAWEEKLGAKTQENIYGGMISWFFYSFTDAQIWIGFSPIRITYTYYDPDLDKMIERIVYRKNSIIFGVSYRVVD